MSGGDRRGTVEVQKKYSPFVVRDCTFWGTDLSSAGIAGSSIRPEPLEIQGVDMEEAEDAEYRSDFDAVDFQSMASKSDQLLLRPIPNGLVRDPRGRQV
jgi:hypothetical protein